MAYLIKLVALVGPWPRLKPLRCVGTGGRETGKEFSTYGAPRTLYLATAEERTKMAREETKEVDANFGGKQKRNRPVNLFVKTRRHGAARKGQGKDIPRPRTSTSQHRRSSAPSS
jgi:hypothetical protein